MADAETPRLIYDGECEFCRECVAYAHAVTDDRVAYLPYQDVADQYPDIDEKDFARSIYLITVDGSRYTGAHATFATLAYNSNYRLPLWLYRHVPGVATVSEWGYRIVARHRPLAMRLTRLLVGTLRPRTTHRIRNVFLRGLGLIFLIAFASWGWQMTGLIGESGILPADERLAAGHNQLGAAAYWQVPTLLWISASNTAQYVVLALGVVCSLLLMVARLPRLALIGAYVAYLSFVSAGAVFMTYQWDTLLLETAFVGLLWSLIPAGVWLARFLLVKFELLSGLGKLVAGDSTWTNFTALTYHYQTQPLPTPLAWYLHHLPDWFHAITTGGVLVSQTLVPLLVFMPRRVRFVAGGVLALVQVGILLTGNYNFFNLLTLLLILTVLDDAALRALLPQRLWARLQPRIRSSRSTAIRVGAGIIAVVYLGMGLFQIVRYPLEHLPQPAQALQQQTRQLHLSNTYGLFTNMTTRRPEVVVQGSRDGETWQTYRFAHKPDAPDAALPIVAPHQPRLDWQMWFAALRGNADNAPWFKRFARRLLEGEESVTRLLAHNPFPDEPPRYVRARLYEFTFTPPRERAESGDVWQREYIGTYLAPASLPR